MEPRPSHELFAEHIRRRRVDPDAILRASGAELRAALCAVAACREDLNAPAFDDPAVLGGEGGQSYAEGLREQLSGKRFPELQGVLLLFAAGLRERGGELVRSRSCPELFAETVAMDQALAGVIAAAHRLWRGAMDISTICFATGRALSRQVLSQVRARLQERAPPPTGGERDPAAAAPIADLRDAFAGLQDEELPPPGAEGRTEAWLADLAGCFHRGRDLETAIRGG